MAVAPTLVSSVQSAWDTAATSRTSPNVTVQNGDLIVVVALNENATATFGTPTGNSLTYTSQQTAGVANTDGRAQMWTATATGAATFGVTVTNSVSERFGVAVYVYRNHGGVGVKAISVNQTNLSLTGLSANSAIVAAATDFGAVDGTTRTRRTVNSSTGTELVYYRNASTYACYIWSYADTGAITSAGVGMSAPSTSVRMTTAAIEVLGRADDRIFEVDGDSVTGTNGAAVSSWPELTGHPAAVQATSGNQPTLATNSANGHSGVVFDGTNDRMTLSGTALGLLQNRGIVNIHIVYRSNVVTGTKTPLAFSNNTAGGGSSRLFVSTAANIASGGRRSDADSLTTVTDGAASAAGAVEIVTVRALWTTSDLYIVLNGTDVASSTSWLTSGSTANTASIAAVIGSNSGQTAEFFSGTIYNILIVANDDSTQRAATIAALKTKYGISSGGATGTSAQTLPKAAQSAAGTASVPAFTASSAQTLPRLGQAAVGALSGQSSTGSAAQTLPKIGQAAAGNSFVVSLRAAGTPTGASVLANAVNPVIPTGTQLGDLAVLIIGAKPYFTAITTPTGWTKLGEWTSGSVATGDDVGSTKIAMYVRNDVTAGNVGTITQTSANVMGAVVNVYQNALGAWDVSQFTNGADSTNGADYAATGAAGIDVAAGDRVFVASILNSDAGTRAGAVIAGMSGATVIDHQVRTNQAMTTGNDLSLYVRDAGIGEGTSSAAPTTAFTNASSSSGVSAFLRIRAVPSTSVTGTSAQSLPATQQSAAGTVALPPVTGTGAQTLPHLGQSAAGTFTAPGRTGTAAQSLPHATQSAAGTRTVPAFTGTAAQTLPHLTQSAAGTRTIPGRTGTAAQSLPHATQAATGTRTTPTFTGTSAQGLPHAGQSAAGTATPPPRTATAAQTLPHVGQVLAGTSRPPTAASTIAQVLPKLTQSAAGTRTVPAFTGTSGQTLPHVTQAAAGTRTPPPRTATAAQTLPRLGQAASGTRTTPLFSGTSGQLLPRVSMAASGTVTNPPGNAGIITQTMPRLGQSAAGTRTIPPRTGTSAQVLPHVGQALAGSRTTPTFTAAGAQILPRIGQAAAGSSRTTRTGSAAQGLPGVTQAAAGQYLASHGGAIVQSLPRITQTGAGATSRPAFTGAIAQTLPRVGQLAASAGIHFNVTWSGAGTPHGNPFRAGAATADPFGADPHGDPFHAGPATADPFHAGPHRNPFAVKGAR